MGQQARSIFCPCCAARLVLGAGGTPTTLGSYDYCASSDTEVHAGPRRLLPATTASDSATGASSSAAAVKGSMVEIGLQKECVRLYFQSIHCIHPFLDQPSFIQRCHQEVWDIQVSTTPRRGHGFLALFYIVLALGAITAGDASSLVWSENVEFLNRADPRGANKTSSYVPIRIARMYSDKAQSYLGNVFEISSMDLTKALFLMSVFCQNALKPHSSYMYSGMAVRAALAIGVPNSLTSLEAGKLWWALYCHEIEMCAATGRLPSLREPRFYRVPLPLEVANDTPTTQILNYTVGLADILLQISQDLVSYSGEPCNTAKSLRALEHDRHISDWIGRRPNRLDITASSLLESELITKQKIVIQLRLFSARILLHRPFLVSAATEANHGKYALHIQSCVEASKNTINLLYDSFASRPWFRSWWYNSSYALDASMVLLYVVLSNMQPEPAEMLLAAAEKSIDIFRAMDRIAVTRKCVEITAEVLSIAKDIVQGNREQALRRYTDAEHACLAPDHANSLNSTLALQQQGGLLSDMPYPLNLTQEDLNASLLETNLISNFLDPEGLFYY
ncbi:transcriptional regulatory protein GAL4 [Microdochium nivale]|nr:transcriptional regulatory protein GAL4 [Microdochium nivale]